MKNNCQENSTIQWADMRRQGRIPACRTTPSAIAERFELYSFPAFETTTLAIVRFLKAVHVHVFGAALSNKHLVVGANFKYCMNGLNGFLLGVFGRLLSCLLLARVFNGLCFFCGNGILPRLLFRVKALLPVTLPLALLFGVFLCHACCLGGDLRGFDGNAVVTDLGQEMAAPPAGFKPDGQAIQAELGAFGNPAEPREESRGEPSEDGEDEVGNHGGSRFRGYLIMGFSLGCCVGFVVKAATVARECHCREIYPSSGKKGK